MSDSAGLAVKFAPVTCFWVCRWWGKQALLEIYQVESPCCRLADLYLNLASHLMLIPVLIHMFEDITVRQSRLVIGVTSVIITKTTFPRRLTADAAQGPSHGLSHETTAMAIKKPITSSARRLTSAFCMWGPAVAMVPGPAFACEQLRQPSGVSRTHNRKTLVVLHNRFSLLPSWFREGWGDVQSQHIRLTPPEEKKKKKIQPVWSVMWWFIFLSISNQTESNNSQLTCRKNAMFGISTQKCQCFNYIMHTLKNATIM